MKHFHSHTNNFSGLNSFETVFAFTYWHRGVQTQIQNNDKECSLDSELIIVVHQIYHCGYQTKDYEVPGHAPYMGR